MSHAMSVGGLNALSLTSNWAATTTTLSGSATRIAVPVPTGATAMVLRVRWSVTVAGSAIPTWYVNNAATNLYGVLHQMGRGGTTNSVRSDATWYMGVPGGVTGVVDSVITVATGQVRYHFSRAYSDNASTAGQVYEPTWSCGTYNDTSTAITTLDFVGGTYLAGTFVTYRPIFAALETMP
jgi:hypothetical protein